jgi:DNA-binding transcriptional MerR regulator
VEYTARETARITGVSEAQQRNDRRYGYLRTTAKGWNRYTAEDLAELVVIKQLSERGLTPASTRSLLRNRAELSHSAVVSNAAHRKSRRAIDLTKAPLGFAQLSQNAPA